MRRRTRSAEDSPIRESSHSGMTGNTRSDRVSGGRPRRCGARRGTNQAEHHVRIVKGDYFPARHRTKEAAKRRPDNVNKRTRHIASGYGLQPSGVSTRLSTHISRSEAKSQSLSFLISSGVSPLTTNPWFCMMTARGRFLPVLSVNALSACCNVFASANPDRRDRSR